IGPPGDPKNKPLVWNKSDVDPGYLEWYSGDMPLELTIASLIVGEQALSQKMSSPSSAALFEVELPAGFTHMRAEFELASGEKLGAYYVYVTRLADADG
ncbi:MAG: hypothetical protein AAGA25_15420, partial [Planctomycetota bacterium]